VDKRTNKMAMWYRTTHTEFEVSSTTTITTTTTTTTTINTHNTKMLIVFHHKN